MASNQNAGKGSAATQAGKASKAGSISGRKGTSAGNAAKGKALVKGATRSERGRGEKSGGSVNTTQGGRKVMGNC